MSSVLIAGKRQAGKSHILHLLAYDSGLQDKVVLWISELQTMSDYAFDVFVDKFQGYPGIKKITRANGMKSVSFESGGKLYFKNTKNWGRVVEPDVVLVDEVYNADIDWMWPNAKYYRTALI